MCPRANPLPGVQFAPGQSAAARYLRDQRCVLHVVTYLAPYSVTKSGRQCGQVLVSETLYTLRMNEARMIWKTCGRIRDNTKSCVPCKRTEIPGGVCCASRGERRRLAAPPPPTRCTTVSDGIPSELPIGTLDLGLLDERKLSCPFYRVGTKKTTPVYSYLTYNCTAPSGLRNRKASKDRQQPCFTPTDRCHLSKSLMAAPVRL